MASRLAVDRVRQPCQRGQGVFEPRHGFAMRPAGGRLSTRLARISHSVLPCLTPERVVGQPLDVLGQAIAMERLDGLHDPRVERPPALVEQAAVGHLVGERVLERVLEVGEEARLVEELGGLEMGEPSAQLLLALARRSPPGGRRARPCR